MSQSYGNTKTLIRKAQPEREYVVILNKIAQDENIPLDALGMFVRIMSRPPNWQIRPKQLQTKSEGRDKIARILTDLEKAGLLVSQTLRNELGQIIGVERVLYSEPQTDYPGTGEPATANPPLQKQESTNTKPSHPPEQKQQQELRQYLYYCYII